MPLQGFPSLCDKNAAQIVSRDKNNPQYHKGINTQKAYVTHYRIDGVVMQTGNRCDYALLNEEKRTAYLIELKGSDLAAAAKQLEATEKFLHNQLSSYKVQYRIIANKCKTQEIDSSEYRKYKLRWRDRLVQKTGWLEENI